MFDENGFMTSVDFGGLSHQHHLHFGQMWIKVMKSEIYKKTYVMGNAHMIQLCQRYIRNLLVVWCDHFKNDSFEIVKFLLVHKYYSFDKLNLSKRVARTYKFLVKIKKRKTISYCEDEKLVGRYKTYV